MALGLRVAGWTTRQISDHFSCSHSTIVRLLQRADTAGTVQDSAGRGRKKKTTTHNDDAMVQTFRANPFTPTRNVANEFAVSTSTVRRRLKEHGLKCRKPYTGYRLTPQHRRLRLEWAWEHQRWFHPQWSGVLFTDESRFKVSNSDGRTRIWCPPRTRYQNENIVEVEPFGGGSVMVWAGISAQRKSDLVVLEGNINAARYLNDVLRAHVVPLMDRNPDLQIFQQDNARPHTAEICRDFLRNQNFDVLSWPSRSPDLSPIEHLWDVLGRRVKLRNPQNINQLTQFLVEEWDLIPQEFILTYIHSMRSRVMSVIDAEGGHTRY